MLFCVITISKRNLFFDRAIKLIWKVEAKYILSLSFRFLYPLTSLRDLKFTEREREISKFRARRSREEFPKDETSFLSLDTREQVSSTVWARTRRIIGTRLVCAQANEELGAIASCSDSGRKNSRRFGGEQKHKAACREWERRKRAVSTSEAQKGGEPWFHVRGRTL